MPRDSGSDLEHDFLTRQQPVLGEFFRSVPDLAKALELDITYAHTMYNDDNEPSGYEEISPLIVAVILGERQHLFVLLQAFETKFQSAGSETKMSLEMHYKAALTCAKSLNKHDFESEIRHSDFAGLLNAGRSPQQSFFPVPERHLANPGRVATDTRLTSLRL